MHCVFTYLSGQPETCQIAGYLAEAAKNALAVDNFFADFFFIEINWLSPKSWKLRFFIYFFEGRALFQCPRPVRAQNTRLSGDQ
jgi:hypothetical protein